MSKSDLDPGLRLNRFLARAGRGSRRSVEALIRRGDVLVNGAVVTDLGRRVDPERDRVVVAGQQVKLPSRWSIFAFHKPLGIVSTLRAQQGQPGLQPFKHGAGLPAGVVPVGRLDADSTGLLLWTDDGDLAQALCRPASRVWKRYEVTLDAALTPEGARALQAGELKLDGRVCRPWRLRSGVPPRRGRQWSVEMHEGRKRQIRRLFAMLGLEVTVLRRVAVGPVKLGHLAEGHFRALSAAEERALRKAAGVM